MGFIGKFLFHVVATAFVFYALDLYIFPDNFSIIGENWTAYAIAAVIFGFLNFWIKPIIKLLMLPINLLTLGFAALAVNGVLVFGLEYILNNLANGVTLNVEGLLTYLLAGIVLGLANTIIHTIT